jgi:uncharacterized membrane protein
VEYIIVSPLEHGWYSVYQPKFERYFEPVFTSGQVVIYRYSPGAP